MTEKWIFEILPDCLQFNDSYAIIIAIKFQLTLYGEKYVRKFDFQRIHTGRAQSCIRFWFPSDWELWHLRICTVSERSAKGSADQWIYPQLQTAQAENEQRSGNMKLGLNKPWFLHAIYETPGSLIRSDQVKVASFLASLQSPIPLDQLKSLPSSLKSSIRFMR